MLFWFQKTFKRPVIATFFAFILSESFEKTQFSTQEKNLAKKTRTARWDDPCASDVHFRRWAAAHLFS
jgi:hypothetical protein